MDELYDLEKDPFEMENRIEDEGYRAVLGEMKMRLKNEMLRYGDTEGEAKEILRTL